MRSTDLNNDFLSFEIDDELFGINLANLIQIIETPEVTKVPMSSELMEGIILFNNEALPIINFRNWLNEQNNSNEFRDNVLVVELASDEGNVKVGIKVDKVIEVIHIEEHEIDKVPEIKGGDSEHIRGIVKYDKRFLMLIDINKLFNAVELKAIKASKGEIKDELLDDETIAKDYTNTFISFTIGKEKLAVDANKVIEILNVPEVTKVPGSDEYMVGVVNIRGSVLPVIDPRKKFNIKKRKSLPETVTIMVLDIYTDGENQSLGTIIDSVTSIIEIEEEKINNSVSLDLPFNPEYLLGVAKVEDQFVQIMNIDKVFALESRGSNI